METKRYKLTLMMLFFGLSLIGCGSKKSNSTNTTNSAYRLLGGVCSSASGSVVPLLHCGVAASSHFSQSGSSCVDNLKNASVDSLYCTSNPFAWNGTQCFDSNASNSVVDSSYCTTSGVSTNNGRYVLNNGYCFDSTTNQFVDNSYCGNSGGLQCHGLHYVESAGAILYYITCNGSDCTGYTLTNANTGWRGVCQ